MAASRGTVDPITGSDSNHHNALHPRAGGTNHCCRCFPPGSRAYAATPSRRTFRWVSGWVEIIIRDLWARTGGEHTGVTCCLSGDPRSNRNTSLGGIGSREGQCPSLRGPPLLCPRAGVPSLGGGRKVPWPPAKRSSSPRSSQKGTMKKTRTWMSAWVVECDRDLTGQIVQEARFYSIFYSPSGINDRLGTIR